MGDGKGELHIQAKPAIQNSGKSDKNLRYFFSSNTHTLLEKKLTVEPLLSPEKAYPNNTPVLWE